MGRLDFLGCGFGTRRLELASKGIDLVHEEIVTLKIKVDSVDSLLD